MPILILPALFILGPIAEIAVFILVGREIGVLPTVALAVLTSVAGTLLLRLQGFGLMQRIRAETAAGRVPGRELVHGAMMLVAAALLVVPGFITDAIGLVLFVPAVRDLAWRLVGRRIVVVAGAPAGGPASRAERGAGAGSRGVIDLEAGEFTRTEERPSSHDAASPWSRLSGDRDRES